MTTNPIPQEWIKKYVDQLLLYADKAGPDSLMGKAALLRAGHVMDLVKAFRAQDGGR